MRAEERHRLKQSELEDLLENILDFLKRYGSRIAASVAIVVLLIAVVWYINSSSKFVGSQQWMELMAVRSNPEKVDENLLRRLAINGRDRRLRAFAWVELGDYLLRRYVLEYGSASDGNIAERERYLKEAADAYDRALSDADCPQIARISAMLGKVASEECRLNWQKASELYNRLLSDDMRPYGAYYIAKKRLGQLEQWQKDWQLRFIKVASTQPLSTSSTSKAETAGSIEKSE